MNAKALVILSFLPLSILGCSFIVGYWVYEYQMVRGVQRASLYLLIVGAAHLIVWQLAPATETASGSSDPVFGEPKKAREGWLTNAHQLAREYRPAMRLALVQQVSLLALSSLMLDGGRALRMCLIAVIAHWVLALLIVLRRPAAPSRGDLSAIRYGLWVLLIVAGTVASWFGRLMNAA